MSNNDQDDSTDIDNNNESAAPPLFVRAASVDKERFPDLDNIRSINLKDGKLARKEAKYTVITDRHTGAVHHDALTIKTFRKKQGDWKEDLEHSISLSNDGEDEIQKLLDFLLAVRSGAIPKASSDYIIVTAPAEGTDGHALQSLLNEVAKTGKYDALANVLKQATHDTKLFATMLDRAAKDPQLFAEAAAALNLVTYRNAVSNLQNLINSKENIREVQFQEILTENPWMFGSEYSEVLGRRKWTRDEQQDFVVRRTTDGYIELIEIKTPLEGTNLFNYDGSHKSYYAGAELSKVIGQVQNYIEELDAERNTIARKDGEDTNKIRAKIIVGRDGDISQQQSLRRFNAHLHRIEVMTFDQLLRIAQNVLSYLEQALQPSIN